MKLGLEDIVDNDCPAGLETGAVDDTWSLFADGDTETEGKKLSPPVNVGIANISSNGIGVGGSLEDGTADGTVDAVTVGANECVGIGDVVGAADGAAVGTNTPTVSSAN